MNAVLTGRNRRETPEALLDNRDCGSQNTKTVLFSEFEDGLQEQVGWGLPGSRHHAVQAAKPSDPRACGQVGSRRSPATQGASPRQESEASGSKYVNILISDRAVPAEDLRLGLQHRGDDEPASCDNEDRRAPSCMTACTAVLKILYPQLLHITCMAHLLHNCAERVRGHFKTNVGNLIATVKVVTVRNKNRSFKFNTTDSPSQPVLTRWGMWPKVVEYCAKNTCKSCCERLQSCEVSGQDSPRLPSAAAAHQKEHLQKCTLISRIWIWDKTVQILAGSSPPLRGTIAAWREIVRSNRFNNLV